MQIHYLTYPLLLLLFSCSRGSNNEAALKICNCYEQIHNESAKTENDDEILKMVATCNQMYLNTLKALESNKNETDSFLKAYKDCQEN